MTIPEKYDRIITGFLSGLLLPFIIAIIVFLFSRGDNSLSSYLLRISEADIITHSITLCVFPNVLIFLIFNRFDMLRASRGVLGITIFWAVIVFGVKFLT
jgi:hypothetical protein